MAVLFLINGPSSLSPFLTTVSPATGNVTHTAERAPVQTVRPREPQLLKPLTYSTID